MEIVSSLIQYKMSWISFIVLSVFLPECYCQTPLFDHGQNFGDSIISNLDQPLEIDLSYEVPFFGRSYSKVYITVDGLLSFNAKARYWQVHYKDGTEDRSKDFPFIGVFHYHGAKVQDSTSYQGKIFSRFISNRLMLDDFKEYAFNSTVGVPRSFKPEMALLVTWENVTDTLALEDEACEHTFGAKNQCPSATFQVLFLASKSHSFVFVNYKTMEIRLHPYYQAGFNGGDGLGWKNILPCDSTSCIYTLNDLPRLQGSDVTGRFIFDVGGQQIRRGGCIPHKIYGDNLLEFSPRFASLLGGEMLNISGSCIPPHGSVMCKFGSQLSAVTTGIRLNSMVARCPVPRLSQRGVTELSFSVDGGKTFHHKSTITIIQMGQIPLTLKLEQNGPRKHWNETDADELMVTWDTSHISRRRDVLLDVKLIGFRETENEVIWKEIETLGYGIPNTGSFSFSPSKHRCEGEDCHLFEIGVVEAKLRQEHWQDSNTHVAVSYGMMPLGWFVTDAMKASYGDYWPADKCEVWYYEDEEDMSWLEELLPCPCTLEQGLADFGRFVTDDGCSIYNKKPTNCFYHIGMIHCLRSSHPPKKGSGNQCCYGRDRKLKYAADSNQGSTPDRSHPWGSAPYNSPGRVPGASHWLRDVITFYYCCLWTGYEFCDYYMDQRPTRDCIKYKPPRAGIVFGDAHVRTFDDKNFRFGGKGDFWLYRSQTLKIQGRFDVRPQTQNFSRFNTTELMGVAMCEGDGETVEFRLAPTNLLSGHLLQVLVNGEDQYFDHEPLSTQTFRGVSIMSNEPKYNLKRHGNFTVLFESGVGVIVAESSRLLQVVVNLPPEFKNPSRFSGGLLGTWNDNMNDDFTSSEGSTVSVMAPAEEIHRRFALTWAVKKEKSLFHKPTLADKTFIPSFGLPSLPRGSYISDTDIRRECGDNKHCSFDYKVTGNISVARATKQAWQWFEQLRDFQEPAEMCGLLDVPRSIKDNYNYSVGSTVVIVGCRNGGVVEGEATHTCVRDDRGKPVWSPTAKAYCTDSDQISIAMITGIVVAVVVVLAVAIGVICFLRRRRHRENISGAKSEKETEHGEADAMMSDLQKRLEKD